MTTDWRTREWYWWRIDEVLGTVMGRIAEQGGAPPLCVFCHKPVDPGDSGKRDVGSRFDSGRPGDATVFRNTWRNREPAVVHHACLTERAFGPQPGDTCDLCGAPATRVLELTAQRRTLRCDRHEVVPPRPPPGRRPVTKQRMWQISMRAQGRCVLCGKPADGYSHCGVCREKQRERERRKRAERAQTSPRRRYGCSRCGELGHNRASCQREQKAEGLAEPDPPVSAIASRPVVVVGGAPALSPATILRPRRRVDERRKQRKQQRKLEQESAPALAAVQVAKTCRCGSGFRCPTHAKQHVPEEVLAVVDGTLATFELE